MLRIRIDEFALFIGEGFLYWFNAFKSVGFFVNPFKDIDISMGFALNE